MDEFVGEYASLQIGNGLSWGRGSSPLAKKYIIETDKSKTSGNKIDAVRLIGLNTGQSFSQTIRADIREHYKAQNCVMLGINGQSENTKIEIDHKEGRKENSRVSNTGTQKLEDFQPLCKAANDVKRQICKKCKQTDKRWDAKNIKGNPYSFYEGDENYDEALGCKGCYQYDPVEYRKTSVKKISNEAADYVSKKLFPNED
ncbi:MAG: hypothetical protein LBU65_00510 [Planctomycetaceae bacterium]|nr:hypothetical protein [Planctomycetaceae bacterium]